jgi:hypothetical protein
MAIKLAMDTSPPVAQAGKNRGIDLRLLTRKPARQALDAVEAVAQ